MSMKLWVVLNHGIMVMTMDSWLLTMKSWIGFPTKVGFWGSKLSPKLKNCYCCRDLKSELSYSMLIVANILIPYS